MRLMIIGANGFIGTALTVAAQSKGHSVTALILPGSSASFLPETRIVQMQIKNSPLLGKLISHQDVVVNLAGNMFGSQRERFFSANVSTVKEILAAFENSDRPPALVHVSSVAALGPSQNGLPLSESVGCKPIGLYGKTKNLGESLALGFARKFPIVVLRPCSVYGPGDKNFLGLFRLASRGYFLKIATRVKFFNLLYIDDFVKMLLAVVENIPRTSLLNVGNQELLTDEDLKKALGNASGNSLKTFFIPGSLAKILGKFADCIEIATGKPQIFSSGKVLEMEQTCWLQDFSSFLNLFGRISLTSLETGIRLTYKWYSERGWI